MDKKPILSIFGVDEDRKIYDNPDTKVFILKKSFFTPGSPSRIGYQVVAVFVGVSSFLKYIREKYYLEPNFSWKEFKAQLRERTSLELDEYQGFGESLTFEQMDRCIGPMIDDEVERNSAAMGALNKAFIRDNI